MPARSAPTGPATACRRQAVRWQASRAATPLPARPRRWRRGPGTRPCSSTSAGPCGRFRPAWTPRSAGSTRGSRTAAKNHRTASAPCASISGIGSSTLPRCLLIFRPCFVHDQAEAHHVLVGRPVEDQRADRHQRVEPAAGLVDRLADELRGVGAAELVLVLPWGAEPGERHRARVVPGVDDLRHPLRGPAAVGAGDHHAIHVRPVRVQVRTGHARPVHSARPASRRRSDGARRTPTAAAACPSTWCATAPSPRCCAATPHTGPP